MPAARLYTPREGGPAAEAEAAEAESQTPSIEEASREPDAIPQRSPSVRVRVLINNRVAESGCHALQCNVQQCAAMCSNVQQCAAMCSVQQHAAACSGVQRRAAACSVKRGSMKCTVLC
jgi:hypothetical protein